MKAKFSKYRVATFGAVLFHIIGITGILFFDRDFFIRTTPLNLLLMVALLVWTQEGKNIFFWLFFASCVIIGLGTEVIGVNTGMLFGDYQYGSVLGPKLMSVPILIGINWFIIIYCCGVSVHSLLLRILQAGKPGVMPNSQALKALSIIVDGATLAVIFDWLMEPVAVKLTYWQWNGTGEIPWFNYLCWFIVSVLLLTIFHFCKFEKQNKFAVNLLLVQLMFFLVLRTFMD